MRTPHPHCDLQELGLIGGDVRMAKVDGAGALHMKDVTSKSEQLLTLGPNAPCAAKLLGSSWDLVSALSGLEPCL